MDTLSQGNSGPTGAVRELGQERVASPAATARWKPATRIAFRFCFVYLALYTLSGQVFGGLIWYAARVSISDLGRIWPARQITFWTSAHVLHLAAFLHPTGSGDTAFDWAQVFCILVIASVGTVLWSFLDKHRENYLTMHKWFRLFIRFALACQMFNYGFGKVLLLQIPFPQLMKLVEPYGNFSPMAVLWTSIGAAPAYEIFAGSAEVLGGLLLILPVTTTLGALVCLADMTQVFMLNMAYDIPVKILSFHLLLLSLFLLAPDLRRLANFFFTQNATPPDTQPPLFRKVRANRLALAVQILLGVWLVGTNIYGAVQQWRDWGPSSPKPKLFGIWNVERMKIDGQVRPPLLTDKELWRRMIFESIFLNSGVEVQRMDGSFVYFATSRHSKNLTLKDSGVRWFNIPGDPKLSGDFTYARPEPNQLILDGTMGGHKIHAELKRMNLQKFTLVNRGFHWVNEYPFQR